MILELIELAYLCFEKIFECIFQRKVKKEEKLLKGKISQGGFFRAGSDTYNAYFRIDDEEVVIEAEKDIKNKGVFISDIATCVKQGVAINPLIENKVVSVKVRKEHKVYRWLISWYFSDDHKSELRELTETTILIANNSSLKGGLRKHFFIIPTAQLV